MTQQEFQKRYQYNPATDCLGEGGFGKVYKAYDNHLDKYVAIKIAEVKTGLEQVRLKHEVELVNKLPTHPYIANYEACYTYSSFTGELDFAVLQYYEEGNLEQLVRSGKLTDSEKDAMLRKILEGIGFLHDQGIIHRDLKPQNILIVNRNGQYIPKITDFGISKKLDANKSSVFTNSLAGAGTLAYASPEQLMGKTIKKNTDLWSFGVIVCYVYLGKLPFNIGDVSLTSEAGRIELYKSIVNGLIDLPINQFSIFWYNIVKQCLIVDNEKRINKIAGDISTLTQNNDVTNKEIHNSEKTIQLEPNSRQILEETKKKKVDNYYSTLIVVILIICGVAIYSFRSYLYHQNVQPAEYAPAIDSVVVRVDSLQNDEIPIDSIKTVGEALSSNDENTDIKNSTIQEYNGAYLYLTTFDNPVQEPQLREEPNVNSFVRYYCPKDAKVYVIDNTIDNIYVLVSVNGYTGYLSKGYLKRQQ